MIRLPVKICVLSGGFVGSTGMVVDGIISVFVMVTVGAGIVTLRGLGVMVTVTVAAGMATFIILGAKVTVDVTVMVSGGGGSSGETIPALSEHPVSKVSASIIAEPIQQ